MPQISALTLVDNSHVGTTTFTPAQASLDMAAWVNRDSGIPLGNPEVTLSIKRSPSSTGVFRVKAKISVPILETVAGASGSGFTPAPTLAYTTVANMEFILPARGYIVERQRLRQLVASALADAHFVAAIDSLEGSY